MTAQGWLQIVFYVGVLTAARRSRSATTWPASTRASACCSPGCSGPLERAHLPARSAQRPGRAGLEGLREDGDRLQPPVLARPLSCCCGSRAACRSTPRASARRPWDVTFNTTTSFVTNTNWQFYGGETTMSYLSQMAGLAVQNFVSAAVGMAVLAR